MRFQFILLTFLLFLSVPCRHAQDTIPACPDTLPARLEVNSWAKTVAGFTINRRAAASLQGERTGQIPSGDIVRVVAGPRCADGYVWWDLNYDGRTGWTAEGGDGEYWLETVDVIPPAAEGSSEPEGCLKPPEIYDQIVIGYGTLNLRTVAMLDHAQELLYAAGGITRFRSGVMQGSYNPGGVSASFGTHDGGGAVDLSVRELGTYAILTQEIPLMLRALRLAGFAAYLRDTDELYPGSPIHIHAVAVGDAELSPAARDQLDGTFGYFHGFNALPQDSGIPLPDTSGEMVICDWMRALGYVDLRAAN
ncbi:MAG: SH3 domain-containing protein [Anaerolineae bacterium]